MRRVVVSGVGFVLPYGVGNSANELDLTKEITPSVVPLSGGETLYHFDMEDLSSHRLYPPRKELRHMRPDAIFATIATELAIESAALGDDYDHSNTLYYTSTGQCYGDMSSYIKAGLEASLTDGTFDLHKFGEVGRTRVNPFFSIRTLGALPMAISSNKLQLHGENYVSESFGAESIAPLRDAVRDIKSGSSDLAIVAAQDYLLNITELDNLYFNEFYNGAFYGSSSAVVLILEELEANRARSGSCYGEILQCEQHFYPVKSNNQIQFPETPFQELQKKIDSPCDHVHLTSTGTEECHEKELDAVIKLFPHATEHDYFGTFGSLLAASEPFGTLMHLLTAKGRGVSLSRSVCGLEGAVVIDTEVSHV